MNYDEYEDRTDANQLCCKRITISLPPPLLEQVCRKSTEHKVSAAWVVRDALEYYFLNNHPQGPSAVVPPNNTIQ
jgi:hypothetical protein